MLFLLLLLLVPEDLSPSLVLFARLDEAAVACGMVVVGRVFFFFLSRLSFFFFFFFFVVVGKRWPLKIISSPLLTVPLGLVAGRLPRGRLNLALGFLKNGADRGVVCRVV